MMIHTLTALAVAGRRAVTVVTARLAQPENPNACLPPGFSSPGAVDRISVISPAI